MNRVLNFNEFMEMNSCDKEIVVVNSATELALIRKNFPSEDIRIRLVLKSVDRELMDILLMINTPFEIVLASDELEESSMLELSRFKNTTGNKVYVTYNIDGRSLFERSSVIYYINRYGVMALLSTSDNELYKSWAQEIRKYTKKNNVKKLSRTYVGE